MKKENPKRKSIKRFFLEKKESSVLSLKKPKCNPIIEPDSNNAWESWQTFNPASIYLNEEVHFLYRAIGEGGLSVLGYASSKNGIDIEERFKKPAYFIKKYNIVSDSQEKKSNKLLSYCSGGSFSGCEDPRMVEIEGVIYMTHTIFSNWSFVRVALSFIKKEDFLNKKWHKWSNPVFISPSQEIHKNWVIFPEKIKGKFAVLHSISPNILVDYFDSLNFNDKNFIESCYIPEPVENGWESYRRGAGPPPIKTEYGWLLLYHGVDENDSSKYKLGAMVLDLENPTKVLYCAKEPILEPDSYYENEGFKPGVVYSCGAIVKEEELFVYYGGADSVVCVAAAPLKDFMNSLVKKEKPKLKFVGKLKKFKKKILNWIK